MKNIKHLARRIVMKHTEAYMQGIDYKPENHQELYDNMIEECAFIITEAFLNGELTPMEYNDLRNEVSNVLWSIFEQFIIKEQEA